MDASAPAISAKSISKSFKVWRRPPVQALKDVSFEVGKGEIVGLIGPNGAGKTTLLRIILGFLKATAGECSILDDAPESMAVRAQIGYQADSSFRSKSVRTQSYLRLHESFSDDGTKPSQIDDYLKHFNLPNAADRSLGALSKGMRQKIELVQAFLGSPAIVFLDEPTASLDPPSVFELREFLIKKKSEGVTILFSSHNLTEVEHTCDRVLFINDGVICGRYSMADIQPGFLESAFRQHLVERSAS